MKNLNILWTNADKITAEKMVFMYAYNSKKKKWWENVTLIIWGKTQLLSVEDEDIKELIKDCIDIGVRVTACLACANMLQTKERLNDLGVETIFWGEPLTEILKNDGKLLTI